MAVAKAADILITTYCLTYNTYTRTVEQTLIRVQFSVLRQGPRGYRNALKDITLNAFALQRMEIYIHIYMCDTG